MLREPRCKYDHEPSARLKGIEESFINGGLCYPTLRGPGAHLFVSVGRG
jgi:hypothetical protein